MHLVVEHVAWVDSGPALRELLEGLLRIGAIRSGHRPVGELFVGVEDVLAVKVLQEGRHMAAGEHACVVVIKDDCDLGG